MNTSSHADSISLRNAPDISTTGTFPDSMVIVWQAGFVIPKHATRATAKPCQHDEFRFFIKRTLKRILPIATEKIFLAAMSDRSPEPGERLRVLKDGFWEQTAVYRREDGKLVVRKTSKITDRTSPWSLQTLRREIAYLQELPPAAKPCFPELLRVWGTDETDEIVGFEIPYYERWVNGYEWLQELPRQADADQFQGALATLVLDRVHVPEQPDEPLGGHVEEVLARSLHELVRQPEFNTLMSATQVVVNGETLPGFPEVCSALQRKRLFDRLDRPPRVRLHGDLILENILLHPHSSGNPADRWRIILVDPVSVAGVSAGHPLFDLVKYETYAGGELCAIRSESLTCRFPGEAGAGDDYHYQIDLRRPNLEPFRCVDLSETFRMRFEERYGTIDQELYDLLDGYFSLVMALNTRGLQQRVRILHGLRALNRSAGVQ